MTGCCAVEGGMGLSRDDRTMTEIENLAVHRQCWRL